MLSTSMAESGPSSPRRLSLSREKATVFFLRGKEKESENTGTSSTRHGAKPGEVKGFVGVISTVVSTGVFMIWAFLPESWLHAVGFSYYPDRFWSVAIPAYIMMATVFVCLAYTSLCYIVTPPPDSLYTLYDDHTRQPLNSSSNIPEGEEQPIHPISDYPITEMNQRMFGMRYVKA